MAQKKWNCIRKKAFSAISDHMLGEKTITAHAYKKCAQRERRFLPPPKVPLPVLTMPNLTLLALMLDFALSSPDPINDPAPWFYEEWIDITGRDHAPWSDDSTPASSGMSSDDHTAVKAFVRRYVAITDARERMDFAFLSDCAARTPYDDVGRQKLSDWFAGQWKLWDLNTIYDECMVKANRDIYVLAASSETGNTVSSCIVSIHSY